MMHGYRGLAGAVAALTLFVLSLGLCGAGRALASQEFVAADGMFQLALPEGWAAVQGDDAKRQSLEYTKMRPVLERRLKKLTALFKRNQDVGGAALFLDYPAKARIHGVAAYWNKYVANLRLLDEKYGHKDLKHRLGFVDRTPYLRQMGPEPSLGLFMYTTRYRMWDGVLILRFFCPWGQEKQWQGQFQQIADSIKLRDEKVKSKTRGY